MLQSGRYAPSLADNSPASSQTLAGGTKNGYIFAVQGLRRLRGHGDPQSFGGTGRRTFYRINTLVIRNSATAGTGHGGQP